MNMSDELRRELEKAYEEKLRAEALVASEVAAVDEGTAAVLMVLDLCGCGGDSCEHTERVEAAMRAWMGVGRTQGRDAVAVVLDDMALRLAFHPDAGPTHNFAALMLKRAAEAARDDELFKEEEG